MSTQSSIEWTESTWNPITGCTKISQGCWHCYAERMSKRLMAMGQPNYANGFSLTMHEKVLELPRIWKKPQVVFVNSMSDLFHQDVPMDFIQRVFAVMNECPQHTFQVLTKRSQRLSTMHGKLPWSVNIWMGVSVEDRTTKHRIDDLRNTPAAIRFLSVEPLLESLGTLNLDSIHWVVVGGESGPGARRMDPEWVIEIRDQCVSAGVAFFFKQWGGVHKKKYGRELEGRTWDEMPDDQRRIPRIQVGCTVEVDFP